MLKKHLFLSLLVLFSFYGQCYQGFYIGDYHVVGLQSNGTLWGWGSSGFGQLGNTNSINSTPFQLAPGADWAKATVGRNNTFIIKTNGTLWAMGQGNYGLLGNGSTTQIQPTL